MPAKRTSKRTDPVVKRILTTYGMQAAVARACGIRQQAVSVWKQVPAHHVMTVSKLLNIPPEKIRPDIFRS